MKQENKTTEVVNNYCVDCKYCVKRSFDLYDCLTEHYCINSMFVGKHTDCVTGKKYFDAVECETARTSLCQGNHFKPKQSMWSKFVSLFKHE